MADYNAQIGSASHHALRDKTDKSLLITMPYNVEPNQLKRKLSYAMVETIRMKLKEEPAMQPNPTDELDEILENTRPGQLDRYLKDNRSSMTDEPKALY